MFLTKEKIDQINKHIQQVSVRCVPSEKVEERLTRSITNLSDQLTMKDRRVGELDERMIRSFATINGQLQQLRAREDANVSIGRSVSVADEKLELMIRQARQDFEVQLATHRQNVTTQLLECSTGLHQHVQTIKTEATKKLADEKMDMMQKYEQLCKKLQADGLPTVNPSGSMSPAVRDDLLREQINQSIGIKTDQLWDLLKRENEQCFTKLQAALEDETAKREAGYTISPS